MALAKCGSWTGSSSRTCERLKNAHSEAPPQPSLISSSGPVPAICVFTSIPRDSDVLKTEAHCLVPRNRNKSDSQQLSANVHPNTSRENQLFAGFTEMRTSRLVWVWVSVGSSHHAHPLPARWDSACPTFKVCGLSPSTSQSWASLPWQGVALAGLARLPSSDCLEAQWAGPCAHQTS